MDLKVIAEMKEVREYAEEMGVELGECDGRPVVVAYNEGGHNYTLVDLEDLLTWITKNKPELLPK